MDIVFSIRPLLAILVSLGAAALILASGRRPNLREAWTLLAAVAKFLIVLSMAPTILNGHSLEYTVLTLSPGISLQLRVDPFGLYFGLLASSLWIATSFYSIGYMRGLKEHAQTRYFFCFAVALSSTIGVAFAANLLTLFLFYELLTISTYPLVAHKETPEALAAGRKYLTYLLTSGVFILFSIAYTYQLTGSLDFVAGGFLKGQGSPETLRLLFVAFILGFSTKAALMPIHEWLPTAMIAPTPVSALLHAVAVVKAGVFCISRVMLSTFGTSLLQDSGLGLLTAYFVSFTILAASIIALTKDDLKARLAYSTVSQLSYIVLGVALLDKTGVLGGIIHIVNHGFSKITLFFCAGAIYVASHRKKISDMAGIGYAMPFTMGAFAIASLSMIGVPPVAGFVTKWYLLNGALEIGNLPIVIVLMASTILNAGYFVPITFKAFFTGDAKKWQQEGIGEAPRTMVIPLVIAALISVGLGLFPDCFSTLIGRLFG